MKHYGLMMEVKHSFARSLANNLLKDFLSINCFFETMPAILKLIAICNGARLYAISLQFYLTLYLFRSKNLFKIKYFLLILKFLLLIAHLAIAFFKFKFLILLFITIIALSHILNAKLIAISIHLRYIFALGISIFALL